MELPQIFVIGDSISIHYGPWLERYLAGRFRYSRKEGTAAALENLDIPQGANGGDSSMVLDYIESNEKHGEIPSADILLINCGLHDIKTDPAGGTRQIEPDAYRLNLGKIIEAAAPLCRTLVWIRTTPCDEEIHNPRQPEFHRFRRDCEEYNRIADEVMQAQGVPSIDLFGFTESLGESSELFIDHVHFFPEIRRLQAAFIAGWLHDRAFSVPQA